MDQSFYAHNKSLMNSEAQQRLDNVQSPQNQRADGMYDYRPSGQTLPNLVTPGSTSSLYLTDGQQASTQSSGNFRNGPLNGFQSIHGSATAEDYAGNKPVPPVSSQEFPVGSTSFGGTSNATHHYGQQPLPFSSSGFLAQSFPPPSSSMSFQTPTTRPPFAPQRHVYPATNPPGQSATPTFSYNQSGGQHLGDAPISSNSSIGSPHGSQDASRSDTPIANNFGHEDHTGSQYLPGQSGQMLVPSFGPTLPQNLHNPATSDQSSLGMSHYPPPPHPQMLAQQQTWQPQPPRYQGPPQQLPAQQNAPWAPTQSPQQRVAYGQQPSQVRTPLQPAQQPAPHLHGYPQQQASWQQQQQFAHQSRFPQSHPNALYQGLPGSMDGLSLNRGSEMMQGQVGLKLCNLMQDRELVPRQGFVMNDPVLNPALKATNCTQEIMCCTLNAVPKTADLLKKTRLPLGLLLQPFKDVNHLKVVQPGTIVRCRSCRTYINPFVIFLDPGRWKCNMCQKENDVPPDFTYDPSTRSYMEPFKRPEIQTPTIEFLAPAEYLVRPPMPAVYFYLLDVSHNAIETGYLEIFSEILLERLDSIPGDSRKQIGFLAYDTQLYFFNLSEEQSQPQMIVVPDLEEPYEPCPEGILVKLQESRSLVVDFLQKLPSMFRESRAVGSAMGSALEFASNLMVKTGGRISVFQTLLPTVGAGALKNREESNDRITKSAGCLGTATDFYKKVAVTCSSAQVAIDLFLFNSQYVDVATIGAASKVTGGCMHYFPNFHATKNRSESKRFRSAFDRYLTRKIGFEAVMRIRCAKGMSFQSYHGNFFVRSTDLLSLPNLNPDASYAVQVKLDDDLETNYVSFQVALLYTSSKGERKIRVHNLCVPVSSVQSDIEASANQLAIAGLLSKMAVDKSLSLGLGDSREALVNAAVDILAACNASLSPAQRAPNQLLAPQSLKLMPLLILALMKSVSLRVGVPTRVDDRLVAMEACKNLPWKMLLLHLHPYLYPVHNLDEKTTSSVSSPEGEGGDLILPGVVPLSLTQVDRHGAYVMDAGSYVYLYLGPAISDLFCLNVFGVDSLGQIPEGEIELPNLESPISRYLVALVSKLNQRRMIVAPVILIKDDGKMRHLFYQHLIMDKSESSFSYQEFLQHILKEIKS